MDTDFSKYHLPPLINGRRYSHELEHPTPVPEDIRVATLEALHIYYTEVSLNERTLSEASATTAPPRSEASTGTSLTGMTFNFSANNGSAQPEPARRRLPDVQRARKALSRKLKACLADCRKRKVKCPLWHHALRDLLEAGHSPSDEMVVEWAIRYDADAQTPVPTTPVSARVTTFAAGGDMEERDDVIDQANNVFDLPPGTPMPYSSGIHETTASLLDNSESVSPPSFTHEDTVVPAVPAPIIYSTFKDESMFPLGSRLHMIEPAHYSCWFPECRSILPMQELISHFGHHLRFQHLEDPLRMVCPICDNFYTYSNDHCMACYTPSGGLVEKLYGRYFPDATTIGLQRESGVIHSGFSPFWPSDSQAHSWTPYYGSGLYPGNSSYGNRNNYQSGTSGSPGGSYYSKARLILAQCKQNLFSSSILSNRLFRSLLRHRKYVAALVVVTLVLLVLGYEEHDWILSNLVGLRHGGSTGSPSKLPFIGVVLAWVAFHLHRIVVNATRANGIRSGWLSRCALNMFNVACGRRRSELSDAPGYGLGHSRS